VFGYFVVRLGGVRVTRSVFLTEAEQAAVESVVESLVGTLGENLIRLVIYGSKVRGDYSEDSDIDLLVLVKQVSSEQRMLIYDRLLDLELRYESRISLVFFSEYEYERNLELESFFIENVNRDGVDLWVNPGLN
jgi:predicted nucleotidyltransferase